MENKRYFVELSYLGTQYSGWQKQPKALSLQEVIEKALSKVLRTEVEVIGCGRTDTGVHAKQYFLHVDFNEALPLGLIQRMNKVLPPAIAFKRIIDVENTAHARFDANHRAYEYHIGFNKNPFTTNTVYHFPFARQLDQEKMQLVATMLLDFEEFFPFCKANSDVKTMKCDLKRAEWIYDTENEKMIFHIAANRFLRGMVRLIVGMSLNVGLAKISIDDVKNAMENQTRLNKSLSAPPHGLFLTDIRYPFNL